MTKSIQDLREQRGALSHELRARVEASKTWTADDQAFYDAHMAQIDDLDAKVARISKVNDLIASDALEDSAMEATARAVRNNGGDPRAVFQKWLRGGEAALNAADFAAIQNTMSTTTGSEGGFTVATEVARSVLDIMRQFGGMRQVANVIQTEGGNPINFPTSDGTSELGELVTENTQAATANLTFGSRALSTFKYSSRQVAVPIELLSDSSVDVEALVRSRLATRIARITNAHFTTGTGTGQPNGAVTAATVGVTGSTGNATAVTYDALVNLQHSVDPAYRALGNLSFMMNDQTLREIRKIRDGQQRPIFVPGYETGVPGGVPDTLLGTPVVVNQDMAVMAANARSILFGDFSFYTIRDVLAVTLFRFTDSVFASRGQVGFLAWSRHGGQLIDTAAIRAYQNSAS
jgi:HK97 family phage major capsid protein